MNIQPSTVRYDIYDAIGDALKDRRIDFTKATKLRDLIRAGRTSEAKQELKRQLSHNLLSIKQ